MNRQTSTLQLPLNRCIRLWSPMASMAATMTTEKRDTRYVLKKEQQHLESCQRVNPPVVSSLDPAASVQTDMPDCTSHGQGRAKGPSPSGICQARKGREKGVDRQIQTQQLSEQDYTLMFTPQLHLSDKLDQTQGGDQKKSPEQWPFFGGGSSLCLVWGAWRDFGGGW